MSSPLSRAHSSSSSSSSSSSQRRCTPGRCPSSPPVLQRQNAAAHATVGHSFCCVSYRKETRTHCCICGIVDFVIDFLSKLESESDANSDCESVNSS